MDKDIFGKIEAPQGVAAYNAIGSNNIGLIVFVSRMIQLVSVIAGVWSLFNFVLAGLVLITKKGDSGAYSEAMNKIMMSVVGLVVIVASYALAGLVGLLVFNDPTFILNPKICGPQGC